MVTHFERVQEAIQPEKIVIALTEASMKQQQYGPSEGVLVLELEGVNREGPRGNEVRFCFSSYMKPVIVSGLAPRVEQISKIVQFVDGAMTNLPMNIPTKVRIPIHYNGVIAMHGVFLAEQEMPELVLVGHEARLVAPQQRRQNQLHFPR